MTPAQEKPSISVHSLEVKLKKLQRSRDTVINNYQEAITGLNEDINSVTKSIILLKEQELESLKSKQPA